MKGHELRIAVGAAVVALGVTVGAYFLSGFWQAVLIALGSTILGLAIALVFVNVYLDLKSRKQAVKPLLKLVAPSIQRHHNDLLTKAWSRIGKPQFGELLDRYQENGADPRALTPDERTFLYTMVKEDRDKLFTLLDQLELDLRELALVLGWSFSPGILRASFNCRYSISKLRQVNFNDSDESKLEVAEHFLDTDIGAFSVFRQLIELLGLAKEDVFGQ